MSHTSRTLVLAVLVALAASPAVRSRADTPSSTQDDAPRTVEIVARRFAFEPAVIEATVGEPLRLVVRSADGPHGIEIKELKVRKEVPRGGDAVVIDVTPQTAGRFPILCSEYCGNGHADMKGALIVSARADAQ